MIKCDPKLAIGIATSHAMHIFNDLLYSNFYKCNDIEIHNNKYFEFRYICRLLGTCTFFVPAIFFRFQALHDMPNMNM